MNLKNNGIATIKKAMYSNGALPLIISNIKFYIRDL